MNCSRPSGNVPYERTWATVNLDALAHNARVMRRALPAETDLMAVIKAGAYGHGAVPVARAAIEGGATWLGVVTVEEALEIRGAGIAEPLLILGPVPEPSLPSAVAAGCSLTATSASGLQALCRLPGTPRPRVHIEVETGMTRLGVGVDELSDLVRRLDPAAITLEGLFTHFASADERDQSATRAQLLAFERAVRTVRRLHPGVRRHASASAYLVGGGGAALDMVRAGIALYGVLPAPHLNAGELRPVMTLSTRIVRLRRVSAGTAVSYGGTYRPPAATTIATVPVGYADGYPRSLTNAGQMVAGGARVRVAGRVCMDYTMLDVGGLAVAEGDEVTVFGDGLPVEEVAAAAGTIPHELLCRIGPRVPRLYVREGQVISCAALRWSLGPVDPGDVSPPPDGR